MKQLAQITLDQKPSVFGRFALWGAKGYNPDLVEQTINLVMTLIIYAAGTFFLVRLVSAGYGYLTSLGDPAKVASATKEITNAFIGLVLVVTSFFIMQLIQNILGVSGVV